MLKRHSLDAVIIGAGVVGAACAYYAARAGLSVAVVDSGPVAGGTTGAGEGNLLVSDKEAGPELDLALLSTRLWTELAAVLPREVEYEPKGGLVVAPDEATVKALRSFAEGQRAAGVDAVEVPAHALHDLEPHLAPGLAGGFHYPQDAQVQPAQAAARLLAASGAEVHLGEEVTQVLLDRGAVRGVRTPRRELLAPAVVNAAGTWGGRIAELAGTSLPVLPRRGFVLVTEPLPRVVRHKVYAADYIADVASGSAALQSSAVVEGTPAGPVLIGATRERVGFDRSLSTQALRRLASQAAALFPVLAGVRVLRTYHGFRPYLPDHLPAIGPDPRRPGLLHACGHEGAGIGLAPATGLLIAAALTGAEPALPAHPFRPDRFGGAAGAADTPEEHH
ncbi:MULTISPECIES: NAD(P)/FAD-dependent oxidoreductase [Streptomyces]|uniref:Oxidoreductase n=2 Tax=Streptomyces TaxID=1883 RepID=A0ABQ3NGC3_STRVG|nr:MULTISPECIES: FAD-dependent oxidoreductase [Streptomyces]MBP2347143.1 glycine/D-amino acid oxidase-like deaminating enzyme [Streptomyces virginiae]RST09646.1 FAD-dependent oxidoreductase [Streptomyces sp. WAC05950]GGQ41014.1 oxidoreductase [Streptomyces virginiae]GHI11837.1 oxidoreductase [Streptomyces virginiae]GLV94760.1 oxidoreductase [Streptomyces lavendulae subsp. lavendulae]